MRFWTLFLFFFRLWKGAGQLSWTKKGLVTASPKVWLWASLFLCASCVSTRTALQQTAPGTSKERVWNTVGKPAKVGRWDGLDRWTYQFRWHSQEYTQDLFFDEGKVIRKGPLLPYPNYEQKMAQADSMEDYEMNAVLYQRQKEAGFREINTLNKKEDIFCSYYVKEKKSLANCHNIMRGKVFLPLALRFCHEHIKGSENLKLEGLSLTAGRKFSPEALRFCRNKVRGVFSKMKCLATVADKTFSSSALKSCAKGSVPSQKLKCLGRSGYNSL